MKATGVVRRIDDLGRIVIPKEIRRTLKISDGDSIEIFVNNGDLILKKYCVLDEITNLSNKMVDVFYKTYGKKILITDKEKIVSALNNEEVDRILSNEIKIHLKDTLEFSGYSKIELSDKEAKKCFLVPIISNSDISGSVILVDDEINDADKLVIRLLSLILVKNIEV